MLKYIIFSLAMAASAVGHAQSVKGHSLGGPVAKQMAYFTQESTLLGGATIQVSVGALTTSLDGFGLTRAVTKLPSSPVGQLPTIVVANPVPQDVAVKAGAQWASDNMPAFQQKMAAWLTSQGLSVAVYNYNQEVMVSTTTGAKKRAIAFNAVIDSKGRPTYGAPKLVDPDPTLVEAVYTPLNPAPGLPTIWTAGPQAGQAFAYPDAGTLKWRLLNKRYEVISNWQTVYVGATYEVPANSSNPDAGLDCLMDARDGAGCYTPYPTIRSIIDSTGSSWAIVNYIRQIEPLYATDPTTGQNKALSAITVDTRKYDCANYFNTGHYGFVVGLSADQYLAEPQTSSTRYTLVGSMAGKGLSPTAAYSKSVPVAALLGANPDSVIINPEPGASDLWKRTDATKMSMVIFISPVVSELSGAGVPWYGANISVTETGMIGQNHEYIIGQSGDNYWSTGVYDQSVYFNLPNAKGMEKFILKSSNYDDYQLVAINGVVLTLGPYGGDMLEASIATLEGNCIQAGSGWSCYGEGQLSGSPAVSVCTSSGDPSTCSLQCPFGQQVGATDSQCHYSVVLTRYNYCSMSYDPATDTSKQMCSNSICPGGTVQYRANASGMGAGCGSQELGRNWNDTVNIDMTPYLRAGQNSLTIRTVVGDLGEGWIEVEARMCGTEAGMAPSAPPGPGAPAVPPVLNQLLTQ